MAGDWSRRQVTFRGKGRGCRQPDQFPLIVGECCEEIGSLRAREHCHWQKGVVWTNEDCGVTSIGRHFTPFWVVMMAWNMRRERIRTSVHGAETLEMHN